MNFLQSLGKTMSENKERKSIINKLRNIIKSERIISDKAYIALGRYYYNNLRDNSNPITEAKCSEIDASELKIEVAKSHLNNVYNNEKDTE